MLTFRRWMFTARSLPYLGVGWWRKEAERGRISLFWGGENFGVKEPEKALVGGMRGC